MSRFALRFRDVEKRYGKTRALAGLNLDVPRGALLGLVGPNGAGKTTAFGVASGAVRPLSGTIDVLGEGPFDPRRHAGRVTFLPQDCALAAHSSAHQLLAYYGRLGGMSRADADKDADRVLDLVHLGDRRDARASQLSHGMKRRLAVAQALLGDPELVLLDEPTGGLDPHLVVAMREILAAQRGQRTVVVSSHILSDLDAVCDHVAFLDKGRCTSQGELEAITGRADVLRIELADVDESWLDLAPIAARGGAFERATLRICPLEEEGVAEANAAVLGALLEAGAEVLEVRRGKSLEEAYMATRSGVSGRDPHSSE